jgi:hypothetical protein
MRKIKSNNKSKDTWEKIVKNNEKLIASSWNSSNPQKTFSNTIKKLYKRYSNNNKSSKKNCKNIKRKK